MSAASAAAEWTALPLDGRDRVGAAGRLIPSASWARPAWHVILPASIVLSFIALYFSGNPTLAAIVAPPLNRELGVMEHLQLALVVAVGVWSLAAARRERVPLWRWAFVVMSSCALFLALEEVNYGQHYVALVTGTGSEREIGQRSLHNLGRTTDWMKLAGDTGIAILFVALPLVRVATGKALLGRVTPNPWYLATVIVMVLVAQIPHLLEGLASDPGWLHGNLSEFRETIIYWLGALFAWDVIRARRADSVPATPATERATPEVSRDIAA
jgi:hypothetical protein